MDDNISATYRYNRNEQIKCADGTVFRVMEDFVDRYKNVPMAGPNYHMFAERKRGDLKPFRPNTRVYSCILLSNEIPHRWRGRYNEDTDLSIRILKDGYCTMLFNAFLVAKMATMRMKGGNTDELYEQNEGFDGRLEMARSLKEQHPDVVEVTRRWGRWQHVVNYAPFKGNELIPVRKGKNTKKKVDEHGLKLKEVE